MKFFLKRFGRIGKAEIRLDGLTVIAGPNGSGKSTVSRALYTWFTFLRQFGREMTQERATIIGDDIKSLLEQHGVPESMASRFMPTYFRNRLPSKILDRSFWLDEPASRDWWVERVHRLLPRWSSTNEDIFQVERFYSQVKEQVLSRLEMEDEKLERFILERYFLRAFDGQIGTLFDGQAESEVVLTNDAGDSQGCSFRGGKVHELLNVQDAAADAYRSLQMFYLEPRHLMDELPSVVAGKRGAGMRRPQDHRYSAEPDQRWESVLAKSLDRKDMSFVQSERLSPIIEELDKIVSVIHGEIDMKERLLVFKDVDIPGDNAVSLLNIASGVKSIAAIIRGFRNDSIHPGDILIVDEPESNLHPEWQLSFAKFLVLLHARLDMRILLNTHSPYFLKAVEVYSDLLEQGEDCAFYNMTSEDGRLYEAECVTGRRIQEIFKSMSAPFSRLMHGDHYERTVS